MSKSKMNKGSKKSRNMPVARYTYNSNPVPDETRVTLRYADTLDATATVGFYTYSFCLNDIFDPDFTSTGSQPAYYDEWGALYNKWVVPEAEYDVAVTSRTVSGRLSVAVVPVTSSAAIPGSFEAATCLRSAKSAETTGGGPTYHIRGRVSMAKLYGVPDYQIEADDSFQGTASGSPNRRMLLAIVCQTSGSSDALSLTVVLRYRVRFFQPIVAALSLSSRIPAAQAADCLVGCTITRQGPANEQRTLLKDDPCSIGGPSGGEAVPPGRHLCTCGCGRHF